MLAIIAFLIGMSGCTDQKQPEFDEKATIRHDKVIMFGGTGWESVTLHNRIAQFIIENGYGYKTSVVTGKSANIINALKQGDVDVLMEYWVYDSIKQSYQNEIKSGAVVESSIIFDDSQEGFYVPTYLIKGDKKRGLKPLTPDLRTVADLPRYASVFAAEGQSRGVISGGVKGWTATDVINLKYKGYKLDESFALLNFDSDRSMDRHIIDLVDQGKPWVGYYWTPTYIMGKFDMTLLEEPPYQQKTWEDTGLCAFPRQKVAIIVNSDLKQTAPEIVEFLSRFKLSSAIVSSNLTEMKEKKLTTDEEARLFLSKNPEIWEKWVPRDVARQVAGALKKP